MNKYYTKEYIKECDCKEIQELKPIEMFGNFYVNRFYEVKVIWQRRYRNKAVKIFMPNIKIWLPTGDQLDEEIVKIINDKKYRYPEYNIHYYSDGNFQIQGAVFVSDASCLLNGEAVNLNPLIAKIKLLKELLNDRH